MPFEEPEIVYLGDQKESGARWVELRKYADKGGILKRASELNLPQFEAEPGLVIIDDRKETFLVQRRRRASLLSRYVSDGGVTKTWGEMQSDFPSLLADNIAATPPTNPDAVVSVLPVVRWNFVDSKSLEPVTISPPPRPFASLTRGGALFVAKDTRNPLVQVKSARAIGGWLIANNESDVVPPLDAKRVSEVMNVLSEREKEESKELLALEKELVKKLVQSGKLKINPASMDAKSFIDLAPEDRQKIFGRAEQSVKEGRFKSTKEFTEHYLGMRVENMSLRLTLSFAVKGDDGKLFEMAIEF
jgi:hypothetical protein